MHINKTLYMPVGSGRTAAVCQKPTVTDPSESAYAVRTRVTYHQPLFDLRAAGTC